MNKLKTDRSSIWDILNVLIRWRRLFVINFMAAVVICFIIASFLPKWYTSRASIFPPEQETGGFGFASSILGGGLGSILSGSNMALPAFATLSDVYVAILKSRIVAEGVIDKNNLMEVFDTESRETAITALHSRLNVFVEPEGIIRITCDDKDPQMAVVYVNSFIEELNRINCENRVGKATETRRFIEERLIQTKKELVAAEEEFRTFQSENSTISLDAQINAMINNLAELKSQLVMAEIELGVFKQSLLPTHMKIKQKEATIAEIKKQIKILEEGEPGQTRDNPLAIPFSEAPDLGLQLARLTRQLKIQEAVFELLTQQNEQAKIQEKRDTPSVQVLDPPKVPERKSRPKRMTISLLAGMLSLMLTVVTVFIKEFIDRNKAADSETYHQLENALGSLKDDFYAIRSVFLSRKGGSNDQTG